MADTPSRYEEIEKLLCEDWGVGKLREQGFDPEGLPPDGRHGRTYLLLACQNGDLRVVRALLDLGASVQATDDYGCTALMLACNGDEEERAELAECLLERADVRACIDSATALHFAACYGNAAVVRMLLRLGADTTKLHKYGDTAAALARLRGEEEVAQLIEKWPEVKEWRPWTHAELPTLFRKATETILLLAKI